MPLTSALRDPSRAVERADAHACDRERLLILERTGLLDAGVQESLQRYARLASDLGDAPMSVVSMIDAARQYFPAAHGLELTETPLASSYCKHVAADDEQLCVKDSTQDAVLSLNRATTELGVRAYLGSPVRAGGARLGALCLIDVTPRAWDTRQRRIVEDLAAAVSTDLELRLLALDQERVSMLDELTGLGNRRAMNAALERVFAAGDEAYIGLFDLDGFKGYNDRFGHPAGDDLLKRVTSQLSRAVPPDAAFRMGGDEFCVIVDDPEELVAAQTALSEQGQGFCISASLGQVRVPTEARNAAEALRVADARLYGKKRSRMGSIDQQVTAVLTCALAERNTYLGGHSDDVAAQSAAVASAMGLGEAETRKIALAARLHDIGKVAIPDAILNKPGPLSPAEWVLMRRHTVVGQRILAEVPALTEVGELVRSSHERYDGAGYPDGLVGKAIPIGARIIFACDAYQAMIDDRTYRPARTSAEALEELERCAGTQFDPAVVEALVSLALAPPRRCEPPALNGC